MRPELDVGLLLPGVAYDKGGESRLPSPEMIRVLWEGNHENTGLLATLVLNPPASTATSFFWEQGALFNSRRDWRGMTLWRRDAG